MLTIKPVNGGTSRNILASASYEHCRTNKGQYAESNDAAFAEKICTYKNKKSAA